MLTFPFIFPIIFLFQILIFIYLQRKNKKEKWVDIEAFCIYNNRVYWLKDNKLYSSEYINEEIDILAGKEVDQVKDLLPVEAVSIIQNLKERGKK